jgi:hypothetical protein
MRNAPTGMHTLLPIMFSGFVLVAAHHSPENITVWVTDTKGPVTSDFIRGLCVGAMNAYP